MGDRQSARAASAILKQFANLEVDEEYLASAIVGHRGPVVDRFHRFVLDYIVLMAEQGELLHKEDKAIQCQRIIDALYSQ